MTGQTGLRGDFWGISEIERLIPVQRRYDAAGGFVDLEFKRALRRGPSDADRIRQNVCREEDEDNDDHADEFYDDPFLSGHNNDL